MAALINQLGGAISANVLLTYDVDEYIIANLLYLIQIINNKRVKVVVNVVK